MSLADRQKKLLQEFSEISDWEAKYEKIIALGKQLPPFEEQYRDEKYKIKGCQSQVWMFARLENGRVHFVADSDALIVKGLIGLLLAFYQDLPPSELVAADLSVFEKLGLYSHLSPNRANGFQSMVKQMKMYAVAFQYQMNQGG